MRKAFKEWAVVDEALGQGAQTILLRKGGIHEREGRFEIEHDEFLIYPTYLHQTPEHLKPEFRAACRDERPDPNQIYIRHYARVADVFRAPPTPDDADQWNDLHIYSPELVRYRYEYKTDRPVYVLLVRVHRLGEPAWIEETPTYAGCRSWVELDEDISVANATPVLDDAAFAKHTADVREIFSTGA